MATFDWSGALPQTKGKIISAQLTSRYGDIKTYLNTFNPGGAVLPDISAGAEYQGILINSGLNGFTMNHVLRSNVPLSHDDGNGSAGQVLRSDGDGTTSWVGAATAITDSKQTTSFTAQDNYRYLIANSIGITATLPASPSDGARVEFVDQLGGWGANNLTIGRNSNLINYIPSDLTVSTANDNTTMEFVTGTDVVANTKSLIFGGTDEYVDCGNDASVQTTGAMSAFTWIKTSQVQAQYESTAICGKWTSSGNQKSWSMILARYVAGSGGSKFGVLLSADGSTDTKYYYTSADVTDGSWHHVGFTYDGNNTLTVYLDGAVSSVTKQNDGAMTSIFNSTTALTMGSAIQFTRGYYTGSMDEFTLYAKALSATEASNLYTYGPYGVRGGLRAWYRCGDGDTYPTILDHSGNSNTGTMTNMESGDIQTDVPTITSFVTEGDSWIVTA